MGIIRSSEHKRVQEKGKKRDRGVCQFCGSKEHPEGHHIKYLSKGGLAELNNIITLCRKCHKDVHRNKKSVKLF